MTQLPPAFLAPGELPCDQCDEPYTEYAIWMCDNCGTFLCKQHAILWRYGRSGERIICYSCRDAMRRIDQKLQAEGDADPDLGDITYCGTGHQEPMRLIEIKR